MLDAGAVLSRRAVLFSGGVSWQHHHPPFARPSTAVMTTTRASSSSLQRCVAIGMSVLTDWGKPWSRTCSWSASPEPVASKAAAEWLRGRWTVTSSTMTLPIPVHLVDARRAHGLDLAAPNIGSAPTGFEVIYGERIGDERAANIATSRRSGRAPKDRHQTSGARWEGGELVRLRTRARRRRKRV